MFYYGLISAAVIMFSFQFYVNQKFERIEGNAVKAAATFMFRSSIAGIIILLIINKFKYEFAPFTLFLSAVTSLCYILYSICSIKALGKINLSLFALFTSLGGMTLPFLAGILIYKEPLTPGKIICFVCVFIALMITVDKKLDKKGLKYYLGVFFSNGMVGVLAKVYDASDYHKAGVASYSMTIAAVITLACGVYLLFSKEKLPEKSKSQKALSVLYSSGYGILNNIGNYLMLISISHISASAQYPMSTGGMLIVSTILCYFTKDKPKPKEIISVIISFAGIMFLVLLDK